MSNDKRKFTIVKRDRINSDQLYDQINKAYKPTYFANADEKSSAIFFLKNYLIGKDITAEEIIAKASLLGVIHGDHKTKISTLIENKFWEQDLDYGVKSNKYKEE